LRPRCSATRDEVKGRADDLHLIRDVVHEHVRNAHTQSHYYDARTRVVVTSVNYESADEAKVEARNFGRREYIAELAHDLGGGSFHGSAAISNTGLILLRPAGLKLHRR
jgi:hypothetical protein